MALSDITEATPSTTSAEINEFVDQLVKDVEKDRQGEPERKSDAQITSEQGDIDQPGSSKEELPAVKNSGRDTANLGEEAGNATEGQEWLTDEVIAEAAAYGISEDDLADFANRDELNRAFRILDKTALNAGVKSVEDGQGTPRNEKGQFTKKEEPAEKPSEKTSTGNRYELPENFGDLYDETIVNAITGMRDHFESRLMALEEHYTQVAREAETHQFDSEVDKLSMPKLFGKTGEETAEELERRQSVMAQAKLLQAGHKLYGREMPISLLVKQAARAIFAAEFEKQLLKDKTKRVSRQSNGRLGGSPTKPLPPSENPRDHFDRLYKELSQQN